MYSVRQFILGPENEYLAVSREIDEADLSEIRQWSGKRGDLISSAPMAHSWNFHPLPTGYFCLSRTNRAALLFPNTDPDAVFTHGILVPQLLLKDYANNVLLLARHLEKLGFWRAGLEVTRQLLDVSDEDRRKRAASFSDCRSLPVLRTLSMDGGAEAVRLNSLNAFVRTTGIRRFCSILDQILGNFSTIITGNAVPEMLLEALLDVLPTGCRPELSFSTGLRFSSDRFFRVVFVGNSEEEQKKIQRQFALPVISSTSVSLMQDQLLPTLRNRWSMFIATLFEQNKEMEWGEIAVLDETSSLQELSRRARFWFRKLGLETIYQKIRESRKKGAFSDDAYGIFKTRVSDSEEVQRLLALIFRGLRDSRDERGQSARGFEEAGADSCGQSIGGGESFRQNVRADFSGAYGQNVSGGDFSDCGGSGASGNEALEASRLRRLSELLAESERGEKKANSERAFPVKRQDEWRDATGNVPEGLFSLDDEQVLKRWENGAMRELISGDEREASENGLSANGALGNGDSGNGESRRNGGAKAPSEDEFSKTKRWSQAPSEDEFSKTKRWSQAPTGRNEAFCGEFCEKTGLTANDRPKKGEVVMPGAMNSYLATLSEAMHGNPLAQNHLKNMFQEIRSGVSEARREEVSEKLLREGVRYWNAEHNSMQNASWRQIEEMVDTLSTMLNLSCGEES